MSKQLDNEVVVNAAKAAMAVFEATHFLCVDGHVDLRRQVDPWPTEWPLVREIVDLFRLRKFETTASVESDGMYSGCWTRKEARFDFAQFGKEAHGKLVIRRGGPGLDDMWWSFEED